MTRAQADALALEATAPRAAAYRQIEGVMRSRLAGKEHAPRRPAVGVTLRLGSGLLAASLRGVLNNSLTGWRLVGIVMDLRDSRGRLMTLSLNRDGSIRPSRWTRSTAHAMRDIAAALLDALEQGVAHLAAFAGGEHCCICGRHLTDASSVERGIGPECFEHVHTRHEAEDREAPAVDVTEQIREVRRQLQAAHPDRGGSGDGELFARLTRELDRLRSLQ